MKRVWIPPGLAMLQAQSAIKALIQQNPTSSPREVLSGVNRLLYQNVKVRLAQDEHMTMSLIRYRTDGTITVAGAHQQIIICRAATGRCELHDRRAPGWASSRTSKRIRPSGRFTSRKVICSFSSLMGSPRP